MTRGDSLGMNPPSVNWQTIRRNLKVGTRTLLIFLLAVMATRGHPVRSPFTYLMVRLTSTPIRHQKWRFGCIERFCVLCKINNLHTINVRSGFDSPLLNYYVRFVPPWPHQFAQVQSGPCRGRSRGLRHTNAHRSVRLSALRCAFSVNE